MIKRILSERFTVQAGGKRSSRQLNFSCRFQAGKFVEHEIAGEHLKDAAQTYGQATETATRAVLLLMAYERFVNEELGGDEPTIDEALPAFAQWLENGKAPARSARK